MGQSARGNKGSQPQVYQEVSSIMTTRSPANKPEKAVQQPAAVNVPVSASTGIGSTGATFKDSQKEMAEHTRAMDKKFAEMKSEMQRQMHCMQEQMAKGLQQVCQMVTVLREERTAQIAGGQQAQDGPHGLGGQQAQVGPHGLGGQQVQVGPHALGG